MVHIDVGRWKPQPRVNTAKKGSKMPWGYKKCYIPYVWKRRRERDIVAQKSGVTEIWDIGDHTPNKSFFFYITNVVGNVNSCSISVEEKPWSFAQGWQHAVVHLKPMISYPPIYSILLKIILARDFPLTIVLSSYIQSNSIHKLWVTSQNT